ncbi:MAG: LptF/LptG family permease [Pseudomonadota bacterium]
MWKLRLYVSLLFLSRWAVATFGMMLMVGLLDSLANANEIAANAEQGGALRYMYLRAPVIFDQVFLFTLMLALLLTFVSLIRRNELVALQGIGMSVLAQARALGPVVVLTTVASGYAIDRTLPSAVRALDAWGIGDYRGGNVSEEEPLWLNDNGRFVRITGRVGATGLLNLMFFDRDELGHVRGVMWAERATYVEGGAGWALEGVSTARIQGAANSDPPPNMWRTDQLPSMIARLAAEPRNLSIRDLHRFSQLSGSGSRPSGAYRVWHISRWILPLTAFAFLLVAAPIMQRTGRRENGSIAMMIGLGAGFVFLIFDGVAKTMAGAGSMSPWMAGLGPTIIFGLIGVYLSLRQETMS